MSSTPACEQQGSTGLDRLRAFCNARPVLVLVVFALLASVPFQSSRGLYETTEGRYAECARQTLATGDIDDPVLNGRYHWTKPPLTYVAIMGGIKLFGRTTWGVRAYLIPCFVLTVLAVYWLARGLFDARTAFTSALVYASAPLPLVASHVVSTDALLTAFVAIALTLFWHGVRRNSKWHMVLMWAAFGLAFMTKGPPALLPLLGMIPAHLILKCRGREVPNVFSPIGLAVFVLVGMGWYIVEAIEHPGLAEYWFGKELVARNFTDEFGHNVKWYKGFMIYAPVIVLGAIPWLILAAIHFRKWGRRRWAALRCMQTADARTVFLAASIVLPLAVFMLSKSRLPLYVLPLFVPFAVVLGRIITRLCEQRAVRFSTVVRVSVVTALLFVAAKAVVPRMTTKRDMRYLADALQPMIAGHPQASLSVYGRRLNGLQFYLDREVPELSRETFSGLFGVPPPTRETGLVVARSSAVQEMPADGSCQLVNLDGTGFCLLCFLNQNEPPPRTHKRPPLNNPYQEAVQ